MQTDHFLEDINRCKTNANNLSFVHCVIDERMLLQMSRTEEVILRRTILLAVSRSVDRMIPTNAVQEIEGRPYKEYDYSPVSRSSSSAVYGPTTLSHNSTNPFEDTQFWSFGGRKGYFELDMTENGSKTLQIIAALAGNLCLVAAGTMMGWSSPILPKLQEDPISDDNPLGIVVSSEQGSWIGSLVAFGAIFGSILAGILAENFGRKLTLLLSAVPGVVGWILIGTATSIYQIYVARVIFGFAIAVPFTVLPMYVGEIAEKSIRGTLSSMIQFFVTLGLLYSYSIGPYSSYLLLWILCLIIPIVFFVSFVAMPESPYYLLSKGRTEDAIHSLTRFRGLSAAGVQKEIDELQVIIEEAYRNQGTYVDLFRVIANRKALLMTCALMAFQQLSGINVVLFYAESIFLSTGSDLSGSISTIIIAVVQLFAAIITPLLVDRLGRKILLVFSGAGSALTLGALGLFFYLKNVKEMDVSNLSWLPVTSIVIYMAAYSFGWGSLPWAIMGELFASDVKSKASGITACFCWLLAFLITKFFTNIETAFGTHSAFWLFAICCANSIFFVIIVLPETKGKSLQEIQDLLSGVRPDRLKEDVSSSTKK